MPDWVSELSEKDNQEDARIRRVASQNTTVWQSLRAEIKDRVSAYNERHPTSFGRPNAATIADAPFDYVSLSLEVQKHTDPKCSLKLDFPINSGAITFRQVSNGEDRTGSVIADIKEDLVVFYLDGTPHSSKTLVEILLKPVLFPLDTWGGFRANAAHRLGQAERAATTLEEVDRHTAASELRAADEDLSRRPADLTGAVQHALAALECVAREHCGDHATFGKLLERFPDLFPKPLDKGIEKVWGFASEMGRHLREGRLPSEEEAELLVGMAMASCTYLVRKRKR